jgi:hypothetical protein
VGRHHSKRKFQNLDGYDACVGRLALRQGSSADKLQTFSPHFKMLSQQMTFGLRPLGICQKVVPITPL